MPSPVLPQPVKMEGMNEESVLNSSPELDEYAISFETGAPLHAAPHNAGGERATRPRWVANHDLVHAELAKATISQTSEKGAMGGEPTRIGKMR